PPSSEVFLANSARVLFNKSNNDVFAIDLCANFGSAFEDAKRAGIAHFLEHMFFSGTARLSRKEISKRIDSVGGTINAFTSRESIHYYIKVRKEHYALAIDTLLECFNNCEFFTKELELERRIILNEIKDMQDNPTKHVISEFVKLCLPGRFGRPILGSEESVSRLRRGDLLSVFKSTHSLANALIAITGPDDASKYIRKIEEAIASTRKRKPLKLSKCRAKPSKREKVIEKDVEQAHLCIGFPAVSSQSESYAAFSLIEAILGGGLSSRIVYEVREKRGLSYIVHPFFEAEPKHGYFAVYLATSPQKVEKAKSIVLKEFAKMREREVSVRELKRAKRYIMGTKALEWEDSLEIAKDAIFAERSGWSWQEYFEAIKEISAKELRKVAREIIPSDEFCSVLLRPKQ
ncbi:MAG: insulinase family protein, partial [Candidatus Diapherotrites archaeon]|nr:insulinase family protein [Candidatus Diapherotrites archaeon]